MKRNYIIKRFAGLFLATVLIATICAAPAAGGDFAMPEEFAEAMKEMQAQAHAMAAYEVLRSVYAFYDDGSESYPDDYAGAWIDDYKLHVALTADNPDSVNRYRNLLREFDCVVFVTMGYSLNELDKIRGAVAEALMENYQITSHSVNVRENKIFLDYYEAEEKQVDSFIRSFLVENAASKFTLSDKTITTDLFILRKNAPFVLANELISGMEIRRGSASGDLIYFRCEWFFQGKQIIQGMALLQRDMA